MLRRVFFEKTLLWMEKLANERVIQARLPFLNQCHFKAAVVASVCVNWDGCPNIQIVMFSPITKCQFSLYKSLIGELKVFSGAAVLSVHDMMHCRAHVKFGLHGFDMSETNIDALRLEELSGEKVVGMQRGAPQMLKVCAPFQN